MHKYKDKHNIGQNYSVKLSDQHHHNTRLSSKENYFMPRPRTSLGLRSFRYNGPKLWQTVPLEIKKLNFPLFKKKYKNHLLDKYTNATTN